MENKVLDSTKAYVVFALGYDLMQYELKSCDMPECDNAFGYCCEWADRFFESEEYSDMSMSMYDALVEWVETHYDSIITNEWE